MSEMVRRVARAIMMQAPPSAQNEIEESYYAAAEFAIRAMRDPTDAMMSAAVDSIKAHISRLPAEVRAKSKERQ